MKPFKSFLFIIVTLSLLTALPVLFPEGKFIISGFEFRVFSFEILSSKNPECIKIIPTQNESALLNTELIAPQKTIIKKNSIVLGSRHIKTKLSPKNNILQNSQMVYSDIIIPPDQLNKWVELSLKMSNVEYLKRPLRILYYGDSQIENDRITSIFRKVLQERYGGAGRGLVAVENIYNTANNFIMTTSDNWESESVVKTNQKQLDLGLLCESFKIRHTVSEKDSITNSWVKIKSIKNDIANGYSVLSIFYRASGKSNVSIMSNENNPILKELTINSDINELRVDLGKTPELIEMNFSTTSEITVYGLNLETPTGIMVDNIALRGRSCPEFSRIDTTRLKQMARLIDPTFVILQYGVNIVPKITNNYTFYKNQLNNELGYLKKIMPGVPVLLVGVSDMAYKVDGLLESYPNLENILNTQKEVAWQNGCAFWNLYESMGGKGSMINWVERQPPLGNKDYVHYTPLGAEKVGNLFAHQFIKALELEQVTAFLAHEP